MTELKVTCPSFLPDGTIPIKYSTFGADTSPAVYIENIDENAKSIAVSFLDRSHPLIADYCHWLIWNIPVVSPSFFLPENIPYGNTVAALSGAKQGLGYGKHRYKGPRPPFHKPHTYAIEVFVLDCFLDLPENSHRPDLIIHTQGHILQRGEVLGHFTRPRRRENTKTE